jgi:hypothetical protein
MWFMVWLLWRKRAQEKWRADDTRAARCRRYRIWVSVQSWEALSETGNGESQ